MRVLGINSVFHDPAAALVIDGAVAAAAEEERFSRRKHGKRPVPFSAWEQPLAAARWCLAQGRDECRRRRPVGFLLRPGAWCARPRRWVWTIPGMTCGPCMRPGPRSSSPRRCPGWIRTRVRFVRHHVAHAASAGLAVPGAGLQRPGLRRPRRARAYLTGRYSGRQLEVLATQPLPHSLGLIYEEPTAHLGFLRSSDEYKVMALASYGKPRLLDQIRRAISARRRRFPHRADRLGRAGSPARAAGEDWAEAQADLAASVQRRLEEVLLALARELHARTGDRLLAMAGGTALNCVANTVLADRGPFDEVWVQPAAGDAGTALGAALQLAADAGEPPWSMTGADLGRAVHDAEIEAALRTARPAVRPPAGRGAGSGRRDWPRTASSPGSRDAASTGRAPSAIARCWPTPASAPTWTGSTTSRAGRSSGRSPRWSWPSRAAEIFSRGPLPSPYMLFVHDVAARWQDRIPAVVHVDGTARVQTVDPRPQPLLAALLAAFEQRTGLPVLVNTSLNTAGRPMVDDLRDALECFGSTPVDALAIGPFLVDGSDPLFGGHPHRGAAMPG